MALGELIKEAQLAGSAFDTIYTAGSFRAEKIFCGRLIMVVDLDFYYRVVASRRRNSLARRETEAKFCQTELVKPIDVIDGDGPEDQQQDPRRSRVFATGH